jgi:hypothetical protein
VASFSSPPARRTAVAACDGGTAAASSSSRWPPLHPLWRGGRRWQRAVVGRRRPVVGPTLWFFVSFILLKNSLLRV